MGIIDTEVKMPRVLDNEILAILEDGNPRTAREIFDTVRPKWAFPTIRDHILKLVAEKKLSSVVNIRDARKNLYVKNNGNHVFVQRRVRKIEK